MKVIFITDQHRIVCLKKFLKQTELYPDDYPGKLDLINDLKCKIERLQKGN